MSDIIHCQLAPQVGCVSEIAYSVCRPHSQRFPGTTSHKQNMLLECIGAAVLQVDNI